MSDRNYRVEIVPYALPKSDGKVCEIGIEKMSVTYIQEDDTNHRSEDGEDQRITIETEDAICDRTDALNKNSYYLTIKTDRWAIEGVEDLTMLIKDFEERLYHTMLIKDFEERLYHNVEKLKHQNGTPLNVVQPILRPENPQSLEGIHPMLNPDNPQTFEAVPC